MKHAIQSTISLLNKTYKTNSIWKSKISFMKHFLIYFVIHKNTKIYFLQEKIKRRFVIQFTIFFLNYEQHSTYFNNVHWICNFTVSKFNPKNTNPDKTTKLLLHFTQIHFFSLMEFCRNRKTPSQLHCKTQCRFTTIPMPL